MSEVNLDQLAGGAVAERFRYELGRVLENIQDPNTDPKNKRKITLTLTLEADENRDIANVSVQAKSALAPTKEVTSKLIMDTNSSGKVIGQELRSGMKGQTYIDEDNDVAQDNGEKIVNFQNK